MKQTVKIRCKNNKKTVNVEIGSTLSDIFSISGLKMKHGPISAEVNNKVEGMHYRVYHNQDVEFLDITSSSGIRAYVRSLFFVLCKAVHEVYPDSHVVIDIPVSNGYYCNLQIGRAVTLEDVALLRQKMQEIIAAKIPIRRHECPTEEAIEVFSRTSTHSSKVKLLRSIGSLYTVYYEIPAISLRFGEILRRSATAHTVNEQSRRTGSDGASGQDVRDFPRTSSLAEHHGHLHCGRLQRASGIR